MKDFYDKAFTVTPGVDVIDGYLASLTEALSDAKNQAENGDALGMAIAIGNASNILNHINSAWQSINNK